MSRRPRPPPSPNPPASTRFIRTRERIARSAPFFVSGDAPRLSRSVPCFLWWDAPHSDGDAPRPRGVSPSVSPQMPSYSQRRHCLGGITCLHAKNHQGNHRRVLLSRDQSRQCGAADLQRPRGLSLIPFAPERKSEAIASPSARRLLDAESCPLRRSPSCERRHRSLDALALHDARSKTSPQIQDIRSNLAGALQGVLDRAGSPLTYRASLRRTQRGARQIGGSGRALALGKLVLANSNQATHWLGTLTRWTTEQLG